MLISKQKSESKLAVILVVAVHTQITGTRDIILVESVHTCTTRPIGKGEVFEGVHSNPHFDF